MTSQAPIAQRGKAKQKRTDLRLVGLGLAVTRAGGIPLVWHAYPGNRPDVTQFPTLIDHLVQRYRTLPGATTTADRSAGVGGGTGGEDPAAMTRGLRRPAARRTPVDKTRSPNGKRWKQGCSVNGS